MGVSVIKRVAPPLALRLAEAGDGRAMAAHLRPSDRREILAASGSADHAARLERAVSLSREARLLTAHGEPLCLFGVADTDVPHTGTPWLVGSRAMDDYPLILARLTLSYIAQFNALYRVLVNLVDARNRRSLRWAAWAGFQVLESEPHGPKGLLFHRIVRRRQSCANQPPSWP